MRTRMISFAATVVFTAIPALLPTPAIAQESVYLLKNVTVHPVTSKTVENVSVLISNGKITGIGKTLRAPAGAKVMDLTGMHVFPGMIDSATDTGLTEISAVETTNDTGELGEFNPQIRAEVAVNPASEHFPVVRANGTTTMLVLPGGTGGGRAGGDQAPKTIQGQASLVHTDGWTWEEMTLNAGTGLQIRWPSIPQVSPRMAAMRGIRVPKFEESKKKQQEQVASLNAFFEGARRYQQAKVAGDPTFETDLKLEAMLPVLEGKRKVVIMANTERYIKEAVAFAKQQKLPMVLAGATEFGDTLPLLKENNIPVILGPTYELPPNEDDAYDYAATLPAKLYKAGVKFCFGSYGTQFARNLPYNVANAVAHGLPLEEGLKAVTIYPAEIWGVANQIGSVEEGKWADLIVTDKGDPLETTTDVKHMFIKGQPVNLKSKHTKLYEKYLNRPKTTAPEKP